MISSDPNLSGDLALVAGAFELRPLDVADAADVFAEFSDPAVTEFMDIDSLAEIDEAEAIIQWAQNLRSLGAGVRWAIRERAGGAWIGTAGFNTLVLERGRRGEIAYDLTRAWWGRGVMSAILPVLIDFGFGHLGLHRLEAMITPGNYRSCRLLERHGFAREGLLAGYGFWKGAYQDQLIYGLVAPGD
jgi:[ribosomal protein S5]-alanine N-acetyltransferase